MSDEDYRLKLPCADTEGDYVVFTRLADRLVPKSDGLVAITAFEDGAHVVVHLDADAQRQLRDWLGPVGEAGSEATPKDLDLVGPGRVAGTSAVPPDDTPGCPVAESTKGGTE